MANFIHAGLVGVPLKPGKMSGGGLPGDRGYGAGFIVSNLIFFLKFSILGLTLSILAGRV